MDEKRPDIASPGQPLTDYETRRRLALGILEDLLHTFGMEELARKFLKQYVSTTMPPSELVQPRIRLTRRIE